MKTLYVRMTRLARRFLGAVGLLGLLDRWARRSRTGLWVRSLLSIYDLDDLLLFDIPWWTFTSADRVERFLEHRPGAHVFEWGSGASTMWLARRAGSVTSIEHDADWADVVRPILPGNASVTVVEPAPVRELVDGSTGAGPVLSEKEGFADLDFSDYVAAIDDVEGSFDLIIVDGRARNACYERAIHRLAPGGVLVFDNVDRERYRDAIAQSSRPVDVEWTRGLTPSLPYPTRTALVRLRT